MEYFEKLNSRNNPVVIKCPSVGIFRVHKLAFFVVSLTLQTETADCIPCMEMKGFLKARGKGFSCSP